MVVAKPPAIVEAEEAAVIRANSGSSGYTDDFRLWSWEPPNSPPESAGDWDPRSNWVTAKEAAVSAGSDGVSASDERMRRIVELASSGFGQYVEGIGPMSTESSESSCNSGEGKGSEVGWPCTSISNS